MTLPISIAEKLRQLLLGRGDMPASDLKGPVIDKMLSDGVLQKRLIGKTRAVILIADARAIHSYLANHFAIADIEEYILGYRDENLSRSNAIVISGNSKLRNVRTFKGFIVNSYTPVDAILNGKQFVINSPEGSFIFISDWETFIPDPSATIIGIENPENFRQIKKQAYLFEGVLPLFICRYPQNNDALKWLQAIPNAYLHFGDLDFAGINIYRNEYKKHLGERASLFVPPNVDVLLQLYGNRELYNRQLGMTGDLSSLAEENLLNLIALFNKHKKVLEQEIFIA